MTRTFHADTAGLDFETSCELDLKVVGLDRYVNHPSFRVLLAGVAELWGDQHAFDFVCDPRGQNLAVFRHLIGKYHTLAAFNAGFERAVLTRMGLLDAAENVVDAAVYARCHGFDSKLAYAAPQALVSAEKDPAGTRLIRKFCKGQELDPRVLAKDPDWEHFKSYVRIDARLGLRISTKFQVAREYPFERVTHQINQRGWNVDRPAVLRMKELYEQNTTALLARFQRDHDPDGKLNFNSPKQVIAWAHERGVKLRNTKEETLNEFIPKLRSRVSALQATPRLAGYYEVLDMLEVKQALGSSTPKKLDVILNMTGTDGRLRNQYVHAGAGQTYRTSGRGVQMQNLKRLGQNVMDMQSLWSLTAEMEWTNEEISRNIRQVFTATDPDGVLIVADFAAVESRALAYLANAKWKLEAFSQGRDMYKVLASKIYNTPYEDVDKQQRAGGKTGELSCGYQASGKAVYKFARKSGVPLTASEADQLVLDWRSVNPEIVGLWERLDEALREVVAGANSKKVQLGGDFAAVLERTHTPPSLLEQHPGCTSVKLVVVRPNRLPLFARVVHGLYRSGRSINYYKATGAGQKLWSRGYYDPENPTVFVPWSIYGGKLTGIMVQSFCREVFFERLAELNNSPVLQAAAPIVGQFHDEAVFDFTPNTPYMLSDVEQHIQSIMEDADLYPGFPLKVSLARDYRYIK